MSNVLCIRNALKDVLGWTLLVLVVLSFVALGVMNVSVLIIPHQNKKLHVLFKAHHPVLSSQTITPVMFASIPDNASSGWIAESKCVCVCPHNLNYTSYYNTTLFTRKVYEPAEW